MFAKANAASFIWYSSRLEFKELPSAWKDAYPTFTEKFGDDFTKAFYKPSGKIDRNGNAMYVWQDYVAGTDPTDPNDIFTASIEIVNGQPVITWSPELSAEEAAKRKYIKWGKFSLSDTAWVDFSNDSSALDYKFFKVTVELK